MGELSLGRAIQFARPWKNAPPASLRFASSRGWLDWAHIEPCLAPRVVRVRLMLVGLRVVF